MNRVVSADVSGRRNAFWPNVVMNCVAHAAVSAVHGITLAFAVAFAITCAESESAAAWKPSHARWSTAPVVSGASSCDGCTSIPSRSRAVLSYSTRVNRGSCEVVDTPGVHAVGGWTTPLPPAPVGLMPLPPFPVLTPVGLPVEFPGPPVLFWPPIVPLHPNWMVSAAPRRIRLFENVMALTSSPGNRKKTTPIQPFVSWKASVRAPATQRVGTVGLVLTVGGELAKRVCRRKYSSSRWRISSHPAEFERT